MTSAEKFLKTTGVYFVGQFLIKAIGFCMLPLYTHYLTPQQYGYFDVSSAMINIIAPLLFIDISMATLRYILDCKEIQGKNKVVSNSLVIVSISSCLYSFFFILLGIWTNYENLTWIYLLGFTLVLQGYYASIARGYNKNILYIVIGVLASLIFAVSNIVFIVWMKSGIIGLFISNILAALFQIIIIELNIGVIRRFSFIQLDGKLIKDVLIFCLPLTMNTLFIWILTNSNRIVISRLMGQVINGYIAVANKYTMLLSMFTMIFSLAWQETAFSMSHEVNRSEKYSYTLDQYIKVLGLGIIVFIPFTKVTFPFFLGSEYLHALKIIPLYFLANFLTATSSFSNSILNAEKKNGVIFIATIISGITNITLLYLLIPLVGMMAFVIALVISFTVDNMIRMIYLRKVVPNFRINYPYIVSFGVMFLITYILYSRGNLLLNLLAMLIFITYHIVLLRGMIKKVLMIIKIRMNGG